MTEETPENPPIRPAVYDVLEAADDGINHDDLVDAVNDETSAGDLAIGSTVRRMEQAGAVYNASGDADDPTWKLTQP